MKRLKNNKGIALIIVLGMIVFTTIIVTNFFTDTLLSHSVVLNQKRRLQAFYLAKTSVSFSKIVLAAYKAEQDFVKKKKINLSQIQGYVPVYQKVKLDTKLLKGLMDALQQGAGAEDLPTGQDEDQSEDIDSSTQAASSPLGLLDQKKMNDFLDFDGDFFGEIQEESGKFSINSTSKMSTNSPEYDLQKRILVTLLKKPELRNFYRNQDQDSIELAHAISDFADPNGMINEFDKIERGSEDSLYQGDYRSKDAPFMTLSELRLVPGMSDDLFESMKDWLTVYSTSQTVNICHADPELVDALILHYSRYSECTSPLDPDDEDELEEVRGVALAACPDKVEVAKALNVELGVLDPEVLTQKTSTAEQKTTASKNADCKIQFDELINDDNNIFKIVGTGEVGDMAVKITEVIDISAKKPSGWKTLYYQVE